MRKKGELTKERILEKAVCLINKKGVEDTSINDLMLATGLKKGSLYFHFPGKDALALSALEKVKTDLFVFLDSVLSGKTPGECLDHFFKEVLAKHKRAGFSGG